jgi:hypothetical protein
MAFVPNMPLACYTPARNSLTGATEADLLAMLSPKRSALKQLSLGYMLGTLHYGKLGDYDDDAFADDRVAAPLAEFKRRIASIGETVTERNQSRRPYVFLEAAGVPQSINV